MCSRVTYWTVSTFRFNLVASPCSWTYRPLGYEVMTWRNNIARKCYTSCEFYHTRVLDTQSYTCTGYTCTGYTIIHVYWIHNHTRVLDTQSYTCTGYTIKATHWIHFLTGFDHGNFLGYFNICPTRCNITQFILSGNCSTCFGRYFHPSLGANTTVSTASSICHAVTVICRYRGRVGTGLSVLWVAYINTSSGAQTTIYTAFGIYHTVTAICTAHSNQFQLFHDSGR
jgi:hypothetical protein